MIAEQRIAGLGLASILATGCATLTAPRYQMLQVESIPPGATVKVNGAEAARAPVAVPIDRAKPPPVVEVSMPEKPPFVCPVWTTPGSGYVVSDVLLCVFLFPIGCISFVDAGGAWNVLAMPVCRVNFEAPGAPESAQPPGQRSQPGTSTGGPPQPPPVPPYPGPGPLPQPGPTPGPGQ